MDDVTLEQAIELIQAKAAKAGNGKSTKKAPAKKTAAKKKTTAKKATAKKSAAPKKPAAAAGDD